MLIKQKVCCYYLVRKVVFRRWFLVVSVVSALAVILFSVQSVRGRYIVVVLVCLGMSWDVFICRTCLGHICSVEEKLEFKRGEDVLEEVEKFC